MEDQHKAVLRNTRVKLIQEISGIDELLDYMEALQIFTPLMVEDIRAERTRAAQARRLLNDLPRRGPKAYSTFMYVLRTTSQTHLADLLNIEQEKLLQGDNSCPIAPSGEQTGITTRGYTVQQPSDLNAVSPPSGVPVASTSGHVLERPTAQHTAQQRHANPGIHAQASGDIESAMETTDTTSSNRGRGHHHGSRPEFSYTGLSLDEKYKMESSPRGYVLIINNIKFDSPEMPTRQGALADGDNLYRLFSNLGFLIDIKKDLKAEEMRKKIEAYAALDAHKNLDCCILAIFSHGDKDGVIYGVDGDSLKLQEIYTYFDSSRCPALRGKPKLFILQACRGKAVCGENGASEASPDVISFTGDPKPKLPQPARPLPPNDPRVQFNRSIENSLPTRSDMLLAYSTPEGFVSYRNTEKGSWFIQAIVEIFESVTNCEKFDVVNLLIRVNNIVAKWECRHLTGDEHSNPSSRRQVPNYQIPAPVVMLTKSWFLNPPGKR